MFVFAADFGFARFLGDGLMTETQCGSPIYMVSKHFLSSRSLEYFNFYW